MANSQPPSKTKTQAYTAENIQVLEGLEPVRKRPGMYIGSTDIIGLHESLREIIDNSVDEALAGFAKNVWIYLNEDKSVTVADDGRVVASRPAGRALLQYGRGDVPPACSIMRKLRRHP